MRVFLLLAFVFSSFGIANAKSLTIGIVQEWDNFHPVSYATAASEGFMHFFNRAMTIQNEMGIVEAEVAQVVPSFKNGLAKIVNEKNGKVVKANWEIRKEAKWSDGTPVTCEDWDFGWQVGMNDNVSKLEKTHYSKITKIEWKDTNKKLCLVTYSNDSWTFDRDLPPLLPKHIEGPVFEKWKTKPMGYEQNSNYVVNPSLPGLYNGPYVIKEIKIGSHVVFAVNENYWGTKAQITPIIVKHIGDTNTLKANLESGQIDMVSAVGFPPDLALSFAKDEAKQNYRVQFVNSPLFQGLFFNLENEILKEKDVRLAIASAIDKKKIVTAFFDSKLSPAYTIFGQKDPSFTDRNSKPDLKKSNQLLEASGWKLLPGKSIREKNGKTLSLDFKTSAGIRVLEMIQLTICDDLKKAGIQCEIKNQTPREFLGDTVPHGKFAMGMFGQETPYDSSLTGSYHSHEIPSETNAWAGGNTFRLRSAEIDSLLKQIETEWDRKKRITALKKIDSIMIENAYLIPLYHRREAFVLPKKFSGLSNSNKGTNFIFPEKWSLAN